MSKEKYQLSIDSKDSKDSNHCYCNSGNDHKEEPKKSLLIDKKLNNKKETKMKIYLYGENLIQLIIKNNIPFIKNNDGIQIGDYLLFNWKFLYLETISEANNTLIINYIKDDFLEEEFNDIIIVTVNKLLDENTIKFLSQFQNFTTQISKQPLILFLTKEEENPNIEELYTLITNYYFDKRNIYALKYPSISDEKESKLIMDFINKSMSYYHEYGDLYDSVNDDILSNYKLNILMCGKAGTGKSSFVNKFLNEKRAKEGEGLSQTHRIIRFTHQKYPLTIYDTPGFENEKTVEEVRKLLEKHNKILNDARKKINLILYFSYYSDRAFYNFELPILKDLVKYDSEIIFVLNFVTDPIDKSHYKRIYNIYEDALKIIYKDVINFKIIINPINIYPQLDDQSEEIKIKRLPFGMDVLFETIYNIFKPMIIDSKEFDKMTKVDDIFSFLGSNKLYKPFKQENDFQLSLRIEIIRIILKFARFNIISFNKEKNREEMVNKIYLTYLGKKCENYEKLNNDLEKSNIEVLKYQLFIEIQILKDLKKEEPIMVFFENIHDAKTLALGYLCYSEINKIFEKDPNNYIKNNNVNLELIKKISISLNNGIESFRLISEEFKELYKKEKEKFKQEKKNKKLQEDEDKEEITIDVEKNEG